MNRRRFLASTAAASLAFSLRGADSKRPPRILLQRGECEKGYCKPFSLSISDGETGMTARFDSPEEFEAFMRSGELEEGRAT